ncbi:MAG: hypothetical protein V5A47_06050 [Bacteroidales bacterium]|nr:hypothetical protein [Bacteroidales bacterium]
MMKPYKIFLTFLTILALIVFISYYYPRDGIQIIPGFTVKFPSWKQLLAPRETEYKDISDIIQVQDNMYVDTVAPDIRDTTAGTAEKDTLVSSKDSADTALTDTINQVRQDKRAAKVNLLQYPENDPHVLYPFFRSLTNLHHNNELIRILHYGDSQIEGDRISSYIRNQLQKKFGGGGIGLFPLVLPGNTNISLNHSHSGNWERYTLKDLNQANFNHKRFGVLMSFSRFSPYYSHHQDEVYKARLNIRSSSIAFDLASEYTQCRIFYGYNEEPFIAKMNYEGKTADADIRPASNSLKEVKWEIPKTVEEFTLGFQGNHSPNIYGIALDGEQGVALDNIPLRGSSGTDFTKSDTAFFRSMFNKFNIKLIILHFGVNIVPVVRDNYDFYEERLYNQLRMFKSFDQDLSVIVMGVTDMSRKKRGEYESYPNIPKIRDAQKKAAFRAGCAFWDTYEAMGGKNSMPGWVFADPPLARKDFTHFTYKGSVVISKMFYKALMHDYREYKQNKQTLNTKVEGK